MSIYIIDDHPPIRVATNIVELDRLSHLTAAVGRHGTPKPVYLDLNQHAAQERTTGPEAKAAIPYFPRPPFPSFPSYPRS